MGLHILRDIAAPVHPGMLGTVSERRVAVIRLKGGDPTSDSD